MPLGTTVPRFAAALAAVLLSLPALAQALGAPAPGQLLAVEFEELVDPFEVQRRNAELFGAFGPPIIENAVEAYRLRFATTDLDGSMATVTAQLLVPAVESPELRPLYVFGSGTTGVGPHCAPSREAQYHHPMGHYREYMMAYAGRGFVAVIPDYLGFDQPGRVQNYFNAVAEARVMLDAVRAVDAFFAQRGTPVPPQRGVFVGGYSQGGHAAFAAADLRPVYAPEVSLSGVIGYGATTDVESLLREGPYYAPYIAASYHQAYGDDFPPEKILRPRWLQSLEDDVRRMCVDRAQAYYPFDAEQLYQPAFAQALRQDLLDERFPELARVLDANSTGLSGHGLPALVVQGEQDVIVRNPTQERFVARLCQAGSPVRYLRYPGVRHRATRPAGFEESVAWMRGVLRGEAPADSCGLRQ